MRLLEQNISINEPLEEITLDEKLDEPITSSVITTNKQNNYIGILRVPDISLKRGFLDIDSKYNSVSYNIMQVKGSTMPDHKNGNLILAAHRGNSSVSFFDKLYKLKTGSYAYIDYEGKTYTYVLTNSYTVPKVGNITISRNGDVNTLTLITCTRNDKKTQTVFIFELRD